MSSELEIEFKNLLTEIEYQKLLRHFQVTSEQCWEQENHYYDTPDFKLKKQHSALRIRILPESAEMTLKTPHQSYLLETTNLLSKETALKIINSEKITPRGDLLTKLNEFNVHEHNLEKKVALTTLRYEKELENGLLVLDKSIYNGKTDFELELEVQDPIAGEQLFEDILSQFAIPKRNTPNKIQRAYKSYFSTD